jgi:hypothetical protein
VVHQVGHEQLTLFTLATKRCGCCGELKPTSEFHRKRNARDGLQHRCKPCNIDGAKRFHAENPEHCRSRIAAWIRLVDRENQQRALDYLLAHPCVDCGETDPVVLDFDHRRDKEFTVSQVLHGHVRWEVVEAEIAKCEVRCANCHRRRHAEEGGWFRAVAMRKLVLH